MSQGAEVVSQSIQLLSECIAIGAVFAVEEKALVLGGIAAAGLLIADLIHLANGNVPKEDLMAKEMRKLGDQIEKLSNQTSQQFQELKMFITEHDIIRDIAVPTAFRMRLLNDVMQSPNRHSIGSFQHVCSKTSPKDLAYKFVELLKNKVTNPLKMAVESDQLKKRATFNKWKKFIETVLGQLLFMEYQVDGMFWGKNGYGPRKVLGVMQEVQKMIATWKGEYEESYWSTVVEKLIRKTQKENEHVGNQHKSWLLQCEMNDVLSNDSFGILVYNDCAGYDHHSYSYKPNNAIFSYRYGKCNIVVFRSKLWNSISDKERDRFENGMIRLQNTGLPIKKDYKGYPEELAKKYFSNWGFMGMVAFKRDLSFREANTKHRQWPGHWAKVQVNHADRKFCDKYGEYYFVLGGYL